MLQKSLWVLNYGENKKAWKISDEKAPDKIVKRFIAQSWLKVEVTDLLWDGELLSVKTGIWMGPGKGGGAICQTLYIY